MFRRPSAHAVIKVIATLRKTPIGRGSGSWTRSSLIDTHLQQRKKRQWCRRANFQRNFAPDQGEKRTKSFSKLKFCFRFFLNFFDSDPPRSFSFPLRVPVIEFRSDSVSTHSHNACLRCFHASYSRFSLSHLFRDSSPARPCSNLNEIF